MKSVIIKSDFGKAYSNCFANRKLLKDKINEVDYDLSDFTRNDITVKDLFRHEKGRQCVLYLVLQMKYQFKLYDQIYRDLDMSNSGEHLHILLNEYNMQWANSKMLEEHKESPRIEERDGTTYACLDDVGVDINCELLVNFVDKSLNLINEQISNHQKQCLINFCPICTSIQAFDESTEELTPLLTDFGIYSLANNSFEQESEPFLSDSGYLPGEVASSDSSIEFEESHNSTSLQEDYTWERFNEIVLHLYHTLAEHYSNEDVEHIDESPVVLLYCNCYGKIKELGFNSLNEAQKQANRLNDIAQDPFPVVLITTTNRCKSSRPVVPVKKRMVQKLGSKVGTEDSPSLAGMLKVPEGRKPFQTELLFYLDTGADSGSVGYNLHIIKHFVLTVENINGELKPAIICKVNVTSNVDEDIQVFDIDEHPNWNAIGLSVLKNYRVYMDVKNNKVELGKHENVTEKETEDSFQVIFKKDHQMPNFSPNSNGQELL